MMIQAPTTMHWRCTAPPSLSFLQKYWLFRPGALTSGLRQVGTVHLQVLREYAWGASTDDAHLLHRPVGCGVWVREVQMSINDTPAVVARSLTPLQASHGWWQGMRQLRARPLADLLYHNPQISRSDFLVARLRKGQALFDTVARASGMAPEQQQKLLARCSVFWRHGQPLVVAECFLPAFWRLAAKHKGQLTAR